MTRNNLPKKHSLLKSILFRIQKRKIYYATLEAEFSRLKLENEQLKKQRLA